MCLNIRIYSLQRLEMTGDLKNNTQFSLPLFLTLVLSF